MIDSSQRERTSLTSFFVVIVQSCADGRLLVHKKVLTMKKTITFIYRLIGYTFHDIIAIYYYWQRYYNPFAFLYINTKSEVGPQPLMTMKINRCISQI